MVNEVSDSVSIVSVPRHTVVETLYVKDEPADVVFANGRAFVSASRNNRIAVFDITNHVAITNIPVFGENPRALALSPDGRYLAVSVDLRRPQVWDLLELRAQLRELKLDWANPPVDARAKK